MRRFVDAEGERANVHAKVMEVSRLSVAGAANKSKWTEGARGSTPEDTDESYGGRSQHSGRRNGGGGGRGGRGDMDAMLDVHSEEEQYELGLELIRIQDALENIAPGKKKITDSKPVARVSQFPKV
jgi:hypothetical protein